MPGIQFHDLSPTHWLRNRKTLKDFIAKLFRREHQPWGSLDIIFCDDAYLLRINQQYLHHEDYTDIITFNLAGKGEPVEGEIYISVERVMDNARQLKVKREEELHRVIFHGCLHLCGYKDKLKPEQAQMREKEDEYLTRYFAKGST